MQGGEGGNLYAKVFGCSKLEVRVEIVSKGSAGQHSARAPYPPGALYFRDQTIQAVTLLCCEYEPPLGRTNCDTEVAQPPMMRLYFSCH